MIKLLSTMLTLYIGNKNYSSWSLRPWILLREKNIPFEERIVPFQGQTINYKNYRMFAPNGKVPCLVADDVDDDDDGILNVWDSMAIIEYIAEEYPDVGVWPTNKAARVWGRCVAAEMHSSFNVLRTICGMNIGIRVQLNEKAISALQKDMTRIDEIWSEGISRFGGPFLTGETFTAVDAVFAPVAFRVQTYYYGLEEELLLLPSQTSREYCHHLLNLPSMKDWRKAAITETWRDEDHETEIEEYGTIIQDHRLKE